MLSLKCKVVVLTAMILLLPVLAGYAKEETKEILIGTAVSLSGKESVAGTSARNAYELAIKEVNDRGGIEIRELGLKRWYGRIAVMVWTFKMEFTGR